MKREALNQVESVPLASGLRDALREVADLEKRLAVAQRASARQVARVSLEAMNARGEDGKPLHTNDQTRKAAVELAVSEDAECQLLAREIEEYVLARALHQADAEAIKAAVRLLSAQLTANSRI